MMRDIGQKARQVVYEAHLDKDWRTTIYEYLLDEGPGPCWDMAPHNLLLNMARNALDTPEELKDVYLFHRNRAIGKLGQSGVAEEAREELRRLLYYFEDSEPCIMDKSDVYIYEWIARRRAEGGQELINCWIRVIEDMIQKLSKYCY